MVHAPSVQRLETQLAPACANWHVLPQAPQFDAPLVVLVSQPLASLPSQFAKPLLHAASTHAPARQPATPFVREHTWPHADVPAVEPQLFGSFCTSRQLPEQLTWPVPQVVPHVPAPHTWPDAHTVGQAPQWALSVCRFTQLVPQSVWPVGHAQVPAWHD